MNMIQLFSCLFGKHLRSRRHAWNDGGTYRSRCAGCGKPMIKSGGRWKIDPAPVAPSPPEASP